MITRGGPAVDADPCEAIILGEDVVDTLAGGVGGADTLGAGGVDIVVAGGVDIVVAGVADTLVEGEA